MNAGTEGSTAQSKNPGQCWIGTDLYGGVPLSQITTMKYSAILDWRGGENDKLLDSGGIAVANEWYPKWFDKQPPHVQLYCLVEGGTNARSLSTDRGVSRATTAMAE